MVIAPLKVFFVFFWGGEKKKSEKSCLLCTQADDPEPTSSTNFPTRTIFSTQPEDPLDPVACGPFADKDSLPRAPESLFPHPVSSGP